MKPGRAVIVAALPMIRCGATPPPPPKRDFDTDSGGRSPPLPVDDDDDDDFGRDGDFFDMFQLDEGDPIVVERLAALTPFVGAAGLPNAKAAEAAARSPCGNATSYLIREYHSDTEVSDALQAVADGLYSPHSSEGGGGGGGVYNPWLAAKGNGSELLDMTIEYFTRWCVFLPDVEGSRDNGLAYIERFTRWYHRNDAGQDFVWGRKPGTGGRESLPAGRRFVKDFVKQRGLFMDGERSARLIRRWMADPRIKIEDYKVPVGGYRSWNEFFARDVIIDEATMTIPSRPVTMADRDYVVVSPTDCVMNPLVQVMTRDEDTRCAAAEDDRCAAAAAAPRREPVRNPLDISDVLDVKGRPLSLDSLLGSASPELKDAFRGGNGLSCVLTPHSYHHYHSPVDGTVVHAEVVESVTFRHRDFPGTVPPNGNAGGIGTDFSQYQDFQRGVIVIRVEYGGLNGEVMTGYVASIPVGLDTVGSVVLDEDVVPGAEVKKGYTRLGNFYYGGSLNIILFSKGLADGAVQTRMGNQIAQFNVGRAPPPNPEMPF